MGTIYYTSCSLQVPKLAGLFVEVFNLIGTVCIRIALFGVFIQLPVY